MNNVDSDVDVEPRDTAVCPLCGAVCGSPLKFKNHVFKTDDDKHKLLVAVYADGGVKVTNLVDQIDVYAEAFAELENGSVLSADAVRQRVRSEVLAHQAELKLRERARRDAEREERRQAKAEADAAEYERIKSERALQQRVEERMFSALNPDDKPMALVNYFYGMINRRCFNYAIEIKLVKGLYTKAGLTADEIRNVLRYMAIMGYVDLKRVNYIISDAMFFCEKEAELNVDGTVPNLIKRFYELRGLKPNPSSFAKEVWMITSSMTSNNLTIDQARTIVDKMAAEKSAALAWFSQRVSQYASSKTTSADACVNYSVDREVSENVDNIVAGRIKLNDVSRAVYSNVVDQLLTVIVEGKFDQRYNFSEFIFKTGVAVTNDLYAFIVKNDNCRQSWFAQALIHCKDESKLAKIRATQAEFKAWRASLDSKFGNDVRCADAAQ